MWNTTKPNAKVELALLDEEVYLPWVGTKFDVSFGHSKSNTSGLQICYLKKGTKCLVATCIAKDFHSNFPGSIHGGLVACALDEVMGQTVFVETKALAVSLEASFEWLSSTPINNELTIKARISFSLGRFYFVVGEVISSNNIVCARSSGLYFQPTAKSMAKMLRQKELPVEAQKWFRS